MLCKGVCVGVGVTECLLVCICLIFMKNDISVDLVNSNPHLHGPFRKKMSLGRKGFRIVHIWLLAGDT